MEEKSGQTVKSPVVKIAMQYQPKAAFTAESPVIQNTNTCLWRKWKQKV